MRRVVIPHSHPRSSTEISLRYGSCIWSMLSPSCLGGTWSTSRHWRWLTCRSVFRKPASITAAKHPRIDCSAQSHSGSNARSTIQNFRPTPQHLDCSTDDPARSKWSPAQVLHIQPDNFPFHTCPEMLRESIGSGCDRMVLFGVLSVSAL